MSNLETVFGLMVLFGCYEVCRKALKISIGLLLSLKRSHKTKPLQRAPTQPIVLTTPSANGDYFEKEHRGKRKLQKHQQRHKRSEAKPKLRKNRQKNRTKKESHFRQQFQLRKTERRPRSPRVKQSIDCMAQGNKWRDQDQWRVERVQNPTVLVVQSRNIRSCRRQRSKIWRFNVDWFSREIAESERRLLFARLSQAKVCHSLQKIKQPEVNIKSESFSPIHLIKLEKRLNAYELKTGIKLQDLITGKSARSLFRSHFRRTKASDRAAV